MWIHIDQAKARCNLQMLDAFGVEVVFMSFLSRAYLILSHMRCGSTVEDSSKALWKEKCSRSLSEPSHVPVCSRRDKGLDGSE